MKNYFVIVCLWIHVSVSAQHTSIFVDNFSGIESVQVNPANIADSFYKLDVNVLSTSISIGNTYASINPFDIIKDFKFNSIKNLGSDLDNFFENSGLDKIENYTKNKVKESNSNIYALATVLGPSAMYTLGRGKAIGFTTAVKTNATGVNLNTELFDLLSENNFVTDLSSLENISDKNFSGQVSMVTWAEVGVSYASVLKQTATAMFKVGGSLKLLKGLNNYSFQLKNINSDLNLNFDIPEESVIFLTGNVEVLSSELATNFGQAIDIGFVYEKRNNTLPYYEKDHKGIYYAKAPYSYKLSASITDIGYLNFDKNKISLNEVDLELPRTEIGSVFRFTKANNPTGATTKVKYILPTTIHLNADFNLKNKFYLNTNLDVGLSSKSKIDALNSMSSISITPRYESLKFSAALPIFLNEYGIVRAGISFRSRYFYIGSSSLLTNFTSISKEGNIYLGIKVPIYSKIALKQIKKSYKHHRVN